MCSSPCAIDNNGEGGIFALYSLIRKYGAWLAIPAMLGGAAFLADSVLTPAVSISSAVEGLQTLPPLEGLFDENPSLTLMITVVIIVILFSVQSRGTESIGKVFGSMVLVWFGFLAIVGVTNLSNDWSVFEALNPVYGIKFLFSPNNAAGIALWAPCSSRPPVPRRCTPTWATWGAATSTSLGHSSRLRWCSTTSARCVDAGQ